MTVKEIRNELMNEDNMNDTLEQHYATIKCACNKMKFMGRLIGVLKDLEEVVRADDWVRNKDEIAACLSAIDQVLSF